MAENEEPAAGKRGGLSEDVKIGSEHQQVSSRDGEDQPASLRSTGQNPAISVYTRPAKVRASDGTVANSDNAKRDGRWVTVLKSEGPRLSKRWLSEKDIEHYDDAKHFAVGGEVVDGIEALGALLRRLERDRHSCVIRGQLREGADSRHQVRQGRFYDDLPLRWMLVEIDGFRPLVSDAVLEPEAALQEYVSAMLPPEFAGVRAWWQLSNSAGHKTKEGQLKAHLWFWLTEARTSAELDAWANWRGLDVKAANGVAPLDTSVFRKVQVHYTAEPVIPKDAEAKGWGVVPPRRSGWFGNQTWRQAVALDMVGFNFSAVRAPADRRTGEHLEGVKDPLADWLWDRGLVHREKADGALVVTCPFYGEHTPHEPDDTSTVYYPAGTNGYPKGRWICLHSCKERAQAEFDAAVGWIAQEFRQAHLAGTSASTAVSKARLTKAPVGITAADLLLKTFEPVSWVVDDLIPDGLTILAGKPKLGKSWLMLGVAVAVASGSDTLGRTCAQGDVLYCALEDTQRRLQKRLNSICMFGDAPPGLTLWTEMLPLEAGGIDQLREWIGAAHRPRLIVIDVFAKVRRSKGGTEGIYDADYLAAAPLKKLADETGVAIVIVHHLRKMAADMDPLDAVSGSTGLTGAADTILVLNLGSDGLTLYGRGRDVEQIELAVEFDRNACQWSLLGDAQEVHLSAERRTIIDTLRAETEPMTPNVIANVTGHLPGSTRRLLHSMVKDGEVTRTARGKYTLPDLTPPNIGNKRTS